MDEEMARWFNLAWTIAVIAVLVFLSQTFTGLNIGLMSLDTAQLQVLIDVPNKDTSALQAAKYARKIMPLRRKGNLLLCTILLGNTAVNALMAILLGDYAGGILGWLITTALIVFLCEILPQSVCTRHGLKLGAAGAPIIRAAMILFYPITKPYALILDRLFPQRENLFDRSQLRALVEYQKTVMPGLLPAGQAEMLIGALGFAHNTAGEVMVPLERSFKVGLDSVLDYALVAEVVQKGFSRFPVVDSESGQVRGVLHCKDLLNQRFLDDYDDQVAQQGQGDRTNSFSAAPRTAAEFLELMRAKGQERQVYACGKNTPLLTLLAEFKRRPHLAVVADTLELGEAGESDRHVGIVTLHNIFELILQAQAGFNEQAQDNQRKLHRQAGTVRLFDRQGLGAMAKEAQPLGEPEAEAIMSFLVSTEISFSPEHINEEEILKLLRELRPVSPAKRTALYTRSQGATCGILVLQGAVRIVSGEEEFESTVGPWSCLGMRALAPVVVPGAPGEPPQGDHPNAHDAFEYAPDFTATILTDNCLILTIDRQRYLKGYLQTAAPNA